MFLKLLERLGRKRIVMDRTSNEPYLERYYLFLKDRGERFPFNVFLHKFLKSDPDDVHDHPWPYFTIILRGGYWEWIPQFDAKGKKIEGATTSVTFFSDSDEVNVAKVDKDGMFISGPDRISVTGAKDWNLIVGAYEEYAAKGLFTRQIMA